MKKYTNVEHTACGSGFQYAPAMFSSVRFSDFNSIVYT